MKRNVGGDQVAICRHRGRFEGDQLRIIRRHRSALLAEGHRGYWCYRRHHDSVLRQQADDFGFVAVSSSANCAGSLEADRTTSPPTGRPSCNTWEIIKSAPRCSFTGAAAGCLRYLVANKPRQLVTWKAAGFCPRGGGFGSALAASASIPFSVPDSFSFALIAGVFFP